MGDLDYNLNVDISKGEEAIERLKFQIEGVSNKSVEVEKEVETKTNRIRQKFLNMIEFLKFAFSKFTLETEEKRQTTENNYLKTVAKAQQAFGIIDAGLRAAGYSMNMAQRLIIRSVFSAARVLVPLLTATAVTPGMQVQAAIGFANLGLSLAALGAYEAGESDLATRLAAGTELLAGINMMIGGYL